MNPRILARRIKNSGKFPNFLTCVRLATFWVPTLFIVLWSLSENTAYHWWALLTFVLIAATDQLDGFLARRWKQTSKFGEFWDPVADKALVLTLVAALCATGILASPGGWVFLGFNVVREGGVVVLRYIRKHGTETMSIPANLHGKIKMVLQTTGVVLALIPVSTDWWQVAIWVPLVVSVWFSITSGVDYLKAK